MRVVNGEIWQARESMQKLMELKLPVKVSYRLARLSKEINDHVRLIDQVRIGLVKKHGEPDARGETSVRLESPGWEAFAQEFDELMSEEVELRWDKVILPASDSVVVEPQTLLSLAQFIGVEGEDED